MNTTIPDDGLGQAREILARHYEAAGDVGHAAIVLSGHTGNEPPLLAIAEALTRPVSEEQVERIREWALTKASEHHRLAHENKDLRTEHIASSSAYRNLADEVRALNGAVE